MTEQVTTNNPERERPMHGEIARLVVLGILAIAAFFATRAIAASNRQMTRQDAAEWYRRGERQLDEGNSAGAVDSFRRAVSNDRGETRYVLALADALSREGQLEAASRALMAVRRTSPDDRDVNVQLARVAAARHDMIAAIRYFHDALYAPWPAETAAARRSLRLELVDLMLRTQHTGQALAELQALAGDLPDDVALHVAVAQRFARAGDDRRALEQFQRALRAVPHAPDALTGAGLAAFRLGQYELSRRYLNRAPDDADGVPTTRMVAGLIVESDPWARRLRASDRRRRLLANLAYARHRLDGCLARLSGRAGTLDESRTGPPVGGHHRDPGAPEAGDDTLLGDVLSEAQTFGAHLRTSRSFDEDAIEHGLELVARLERAAVDRCPPATPRDRALMLVAARHGSSGQ
jgi:tetratricopeptide (TPR) repeat protein